MDGGAVVLGEVSALCGFAAWMSCRAPEGHQLPGGRDAAAEGVGTTPQRERKRRRRTLSAS
jgi:hypothetical protein